ncbi:MAG: hypothetical protein WBH56_13155 [Bacteroidota bacterium]
MWFPAAALLFLAGCGVSQNLYRDVESDVSEGRYLDAAGTVRANVDEYGDKSSVLYKLDMGVLYHYAGLSDSSTTYLLSAESEIEDLYTRSISLAAVSMVLNDNVLPYEGEDFEKVLINIFLALNFAEAGEPDEALVEARKVDIKLRELARKYDGENKYKEDAFSRYLAGVLYEDAGEMNDAFISYKLAYEAYGTYAAQYGVPAPSFLLDDLVRTARAMSFTEEVERYVAAGGEPHDPEAPPSGSVIVIAYAGKGPIKREVRPSVSIPDDEGTIHTFQIALPEFQVRYMHPRRYFVEAESVDSVSLRAEMELVEDVNALAAQSLEDRLGLIYLKSGGRAILKFLAAETAKSELKKNESETVNIFGSLAIDILVAATEQADLRGWRTLPAEFRMARLNLPTGEHRVRVSASDGAFGLTSKPFLVRPGKVTFVVMDDVR